jgi:hypothetical protein
MQLAPTPISRHFRPDIPVAVFSVPINSAI